MENLTIIYVVSVKARENKALRNLRIVKWGRIQRL
jgi:hypothetical protein